MQHHFSRTIVLLACVGIASAILIAQERSPAVKVVTVPYDMAKLLKSAEAPPDEIMKGRVLWLQRCAFCHDGVGTPTYNTMGPWIDSELVQKRGDAAVREKILKGSSAMPGFQYGLSAAQVDQVLAFLKTVTPDQKPTPEQKAGKAKVLGDL